MLYWLHEINSGLSGIAGIIGMVFGYTQYARCAGWTTFCRSHSSHPHSTGDCPAPVGDVRDSLSSGGIATVRNPDRSTVGVGIAISIASKEFYQSSEKLLQLHM